MSWEPLKRSLQGFDEFVAKQNVRIAKDAAITPQMEIVREFLKDTERMEPPALVAKWMERDFKAFYDATIVVHRLTAAVVSLGDNPIPLRSRLNQVLSGPLTQDFSPQQAKDFFYELEIAAALKNAGFAVALREPDVVVSGGGLTQAIGLACKYPSSEGQIHEHISKGYRQIAKQDMTGCVVLGLDLIIFRAVFDSPPRFLDFRQSTRHPRDVANQLMGDAMTSLVTQRSKDYPAEKPLDGAILTFSSWGMFGQPAGFTSLTAWSVQCELKNPIRPDLERIVDRARALDTEPKLK
jgi:hypothetical protein